MPKSKRPPAIHPTESMPSTPIRSQSPRLCEIFMRERGVLLADHGYTPDPGAVELTPSTIAFYHYTRAENVERILEAGGGLSARLPVVSAPPDLAGLHLVEGLLEPLPLWMTGKSFFRRHRLQDVGGICGDLLLRVEVPRHFPGLYVADFAHVLEAKHVRRRGRPALDLGYDTSTGREVTRSDANSFVPAIEYRGGHLAPIVKPTRRGTGIAVPARYIAVLDVQPLR